MTGGSIKKSSSYISDKYELDRLRNSIETINNEIHDLETQLSKYDEDLNLLKDNIYNTNIEIIKNDEVYNSKKAILESQEHELEMINNEINNLSNNSLDKELEKIISEYYNHEQKKTELEKTLEYIIKRRLI